MISGQVQTFIGVHWIETTVDGVRQCLPTPCALFTRGKRRGLLCRRLCVPVGSWTFLLPHAYSDLDGFFFIHTSRRVFFFSFPFVAMYTRKQTHTQPPLTRNARPQVDLLVPVMERLATWTRPVVMIPGNHDQVTLGGGVHALTPLQFAFTDPNQVRRGGRFR